MVYSCTAREQHLTSAACGPGEVLQRCLAHDAAPVLGSPALQCSSRTNCTPVLCSRSYRCPYCHNSDELRQREQEWQAAQEAKRRAERQRELEAATAEAGGGAVAADYLQLSSASVSLLKAWKERQCLAALAELGFDPATAKAAAAATGSDADRAVALLLDGGIASGSKPVLVTAEAQELLSFATSLGLGLEDVEMAILMAQGDPEVAKEGLQVGSLGGAWLLLSCGAWG